MSWGEFIELRELRLHDNDRIELTSCEVPRSPPRLERANALRISPGKVPELLSRVGIIRLLGDSLDPRLTDERGEGHDFQPCSHAQPTWCDLCGDFIWGLYKQSLRCANCGFTCHYRCRPLIQLDCSLDRGSTVEQTCAVETDTNVDEQVKCGKQQELSGTEIQQKVKEYNAQINSNLFMNLNKDGSFTGFIKVQFKLVRPVSVPPPRKGTATQDGAGKKNGGVKRCTSFYLPKDTSKHLHISSRTCAREVIEALLKKFTVVDNPGKFALFERTERHDQVFLRKLSDDERPLELRLCAGPNEKALSLVLKENETGEVNWDAFSMPELKNFVRMLQREEEEHVKQILQRYALARTRMQEAQAAASIPGGSSASGSTPG
ncbi:ras association domain-containing protein 1-like isoform 1-T1 [Salvelinus alpinus]|uniref:Ras association domain-containing protein 1-like isoform X1 n=1 Tax=Salvelinus namaycush TaxID=8040 RepID=A0A8U1BU24_SALNM|nr:ras association domain-containing protein 1-like isoform X1 [Salvelinus namaycush]XP_055773515.1 ras association domain-containing protein 1-like isoform X1 [Salvelinus fontinalis]